MSTQALDTRVLELLSSKICHDLISPIGAVNNGVEILAEMGGEADPDVIGLIAHSAQQASVKLQAYRMAYGIGGAERTIKPENVFNAINNWIAADGKISQSWDPYSIGYDNKPNAFGKVLTCVLIIGIDVLAKGGTLDIKEENDQSVLIAVEGEKIFHVESLEALIKGDANVEDLDPRMVHAYVTGVLAKSHGFSIALQARTDHRLTFLVASDC